MTKRTEECRGQHIMENAFLSMSKMLLTYRDKEVSGIENELVCFVESLEQNEVEHTERLLQLLDKEFEHYRFSTIDKQHQELERFSHDLQETLDTLNLDSSGIVYRLYMDAAVRALVRARQEAGESKWVLIQNDDIEEDESHVFVHVDGWLTRLPEYEEESMNLAQISGIILNDIVSIEVDYRVDGAQNDKSVQLVVEEVSRKISEALHKRIQLHTAISETAYYAYFYCDEWKTHHSMRLVGVFDETQIRQVIKEDIQNKQVELDVSNVEHTLEMDMHTLGSILELGYVQPIEMNKRQ